MRAVIHSTGSGWQRRYQDYFVSGFGYHGIPVIFTNHDAVDTNGDLHVLFANNSWKKTLGICQSKKIPVLTVNRCFFGDRHDNVAIGWDGFNGRADFMNENSPGDRWDKHRVPLRSWRMMPEIDDGYILVLGEFRDMTSWYERVARLLDQTNRSVKFRPHPFRAGDRIPCGWGKAPGFAQDDIETALKGAVLCVTYDTIGGVDAIIQGVPTVAYGPESMAHPIAWNSVNDELTDLRDRTQWLHDLAYAQWDFSEIADGQFWTHLGSRMANPETAA